MALPSDVVRNVMSCSMGLPKVTAAVGVQIRFSARSLPSPYLSMADIAPADIDCSDGSYSKNWATAVDTGGPSLWACIRMPDLPETDS